MALSSFSSHSHRAMFSDTEGQPVKSPQLRQLSPTHLGSASGSWCGQLLSPHCAPEMDMATTTGPTCPGNEGLGLQGDFQLSVRQTDRQTAQGEPPLSAELGHCPVTKGTKPPGWPHVSLDMLGAVRGEGRLLGPTHKTATWPRSS